MQKFEKVIKPTYGHSHSKFEFPKLAVADINQNHSQKIALTAATSDTHVAPALSDLTSASFTGLGIISETIL